MEPPDRLACGLCGFTTVAQIYSSGENDFTPYIRAVYCVGPEVPEGPSQASLSGIGYRAHRGSGAPYPRNFWVPAEPDKRWDDRGLTFAGLIYVREVRPPDDSVSIEERAVAPWGFYFHDACWQLLGQAVAPGQVNIEILWRILISVPCGADVPNWGHNYGGLYMIKSSLEHPDTFVLLGPTSNVVIPSAFANPYDVPELKPIVANARLKHDGPEGTPGALYSSISVASILAGRDPFSVLSLELRELILQCLSDSEVSNLRLASREMAATPLSQTFFQSRFWPDREFHVMFDAFVLDPVVRRGTDWRGLHRELRSRKGLNRAFPGERNRLRIWEETALPLAKAIEAVQRGGPLRGDAVPRPQEELYPGLKWQAYKTRICANPKAFGIQGRSKRQARIELPTTGMTGVEVSFVEFFGKTYIAGLTFTYAGGGRTDLGYTSGRKKETLALDGDLRGFHLAGEETGLKAVAAITGQHMMSEYLQWAGRPGESKATALRTSGRPISVMMAEFDGFRMQAIYCASR